jgi:hypothetical protein
VYDQEAFENEEAKARYRAVENTTTMGCNARKTNKQQTYPNKIKRLVFVTQSQFVLRQEESECQK